MATLGERKPDFPSLLLSFLLLFFVWAVATAVWAGSRGKDRVEIKHKSRDLSKVNDELNKKRSEQKKLEKEEKEITEKVQKNANKLRKIEKSLLFTRKKRGEVQQDLAQAKNEMDRLNADLDEADATLGDIVKVQYVSSRLAGPHAFLPVYTRQLIPPQLDLLDELGGHRAETKDQLMDFTSTYSVYQTEIHRHQADIEKLQSGMSREEKRLLKNRTRQQVLEEELAELERTAEELAALLDILRVKEKKEKEAEEKVRLEKQISGQSPVMRHSLPWPISGRVVRRFGRQKHPELGTPYHSNGLLLNMSQNQPVKAVSAGHVLYAGEFMSYGLMAVVEHEGDWDTVYGNMSQLSVEKGQAVKEGDVVGFSGLDIDGKREAYFEMRFYGKPTDPVPWLKKSQ